MFVTKNHLLKAAAGSNLNDLSVKSNQELKCAFIWYRFDDWR